MDIPLADIENELTVFIDEYRAGCLWYMRGDYYPGSVPEVLRVLDAIERHGDAAAYKRAGKIRQWLSQHSSETSAA